MKELFNNMYFYIGILVLIVLIIVILSYQLYKSKNINSVSFLVL